MRLLQFTHLHAIQCDRSTLYIYCVLVHVLFSWHRTIPEPPMFTRRQKSSCAENLSPFINNHSELWWHLQAAALSCRVFIWRTIDTKFPPIPVVPHCFQLQEFEGGRRSEGKFRIGGQRGEEDRTISTGKRRALVHSLLTVESSVASGTLAHVAAAIVLLPAFSTVEAGWVGTGQQAVLTVGSLETLLACTHVAVLQILGNVEEVESVTWPTILNLEWKKLVVVSSPTYCASSSVPAGVAVTLLHLQLTVDPCETWQARACVASLARVHTGGAIHTRMVMGAEVEVCGECRVFAYRELSMPVVYKAINGALQREPNSLMLSS